MKSFKRNIKAISPIFATLILIAIAVIAGIVVYAFVSGAIPGLTGGSSPGQEKVAVQSASLSDSTLSVYYQSVGGPLPTVVAVQIKDGSGNVVQTISTGITGATPTAAGALTTLTCTVTTFTGPHNAVLLTEAGNSFTSPSFSP